MITDVLYSVNMSVLYDYWCPVQCKYVSIICVKSFELSHVMDIAL